MSKRRKKSDGGIWKLKNERTSLFPLFVGFTLIWVSIAWLVTL